MPDVIGVQVPFQGFLHLHTKVFDVIYLGYNLVVESVRGGAGHRSFPGEGDVFTFGGVKLHVPPLFPFLQGYEVLL